MNREDVMYDEFNRFKDLPPDLYPRRAGLGGPSGAGFPDSNVNRDSPPKYLGDAIYLTRNLVGQSITITTAPTLIIRSTYAWPYLLLNPSTTVGLTTAVTGFNGIATNGMFTTSFGVSGFNQVHLTLNVTGITPGDTWDIYAQTYDSISATWVRSQAVFAAIAATGGSYSYVGTFGIATDLRFEFVRTVGAGNLTCSIGVALKEGTGGSSAGLAQVVYIGGPGVTSVSGFPLLEGQKQSFVIGEGVELWGVSTSTINIRLFTL